MSRVSEYTLRFQFVSLLIDNLLSFCAIPKTGMWHIIYLLTLFVLTVASENCTNYCWNGYNNRTGAQDSLTFTIPLGKTVTGVITVEGSVSIPTEEDGCEHSTSIHFYDKNDIYQPFVMKFVYSKEGEHYIDLEGNGNENPTNYVSQRLNDPFGNSTKMRIQISDIEASLKRYYSFYTNDTLAKCTFGNASNWESVFNNTQISTTGSIRGFPKNDSVHKINFMSVCRRNIPKVCTKPQMVFVNFSSSYILKCEGSGAPYLSLLWKNPDSATVTPSSVVYDEKSSYDHIISSNVSISNFSINDTGDYICTITNEYFRTSDEVTYKVYAPFDVSTSTPDYFDYKEPLYLLFNVSGWPFNDFLVRCNSSNLSVSVFNVSYQEFKQERPYREYNLTFLGDQISDTVTCKFKLDEAYIYNMTFSRIGGSCKNGTYGMEQNCSVCPWGKTSEFPHTECFEADSSCTEGFYGTTSCKVCPDGRISKNKSVKVEDCYKVISRCSAGEYGINDTCEMCPFGFLSKEGAVKLPECYNATSTCEENFYSTNMTESSNCTICPTGKTSQMGAAKIEDCERQISSCGLNQFGIGNNCSWCPSGYVSVPNRVKVQECTEANSNCSAGTYGIIYVACTNCPFGETSNVSAVKPQDCYNSNSSCDKNYYGIGDNCTECDYGYTSRKGAGKKQDCEPLDSNCPANKYGFLNNCTACPEGYVSNPKSRYRNDCYLPPKSRKHSLALAIGVGCSIFIVFLLIIGFTIRVVIRNRRREVNWRVAFQHNASRDLIVENAE